MQPDVYKQFKDLFEEIKEAAGPDDPEALDFDLEDEGKVIEAIRWFVSYQTAVEFLDSMTVKDIARILHDGYAATSDEHVEEWLEDFYGQFRATEEANREDGMVSNVDIDSELAVWRVEADDAFRALIFSHFGVEQVVDGDDAP